MEPEGKINQNIEYQKLDISELYLAFSKIELMDLNEDGTQTWKMNKICDSMSFQNVEYIRESSEIHPVLTLLRSDTLSLPIISINNNKKGPAIWILAGMYGNEPSGPNMLAQNIANIARELSDIPTLILPLCNPQGYRLNQRYLNDVVENVDGLKVDDASHVLLDYKPNSIDFVEGYSPRSEAQSYESEQIVSYLISESAKRPPILVIDLQEKNSTNGHIDSYGTHRYDGKHIYSVVDAMAKAVNVSKYNPVTSDNPTTKSIEYPINDGTITEFIAASRIIYGDIIRGISAKTVFKTKVPTIDTSLYTQMQAQQNALYAAIEIAKRDIISREIMK